MHAHKQADTHAHEKCARARNYVQAQNKALHSSLICVVKKGHDIHSHTNAAPRTHSRVRVPFRAESRARPHLTETELARMGNENERCIRVYVPKCFCEPAVLSSFLSCCCCFCCCCKSNVSRLQSLEFVFAFFFAFSCAMAYLL